RTGTGRDDGEAFWAEETCGTVGRKRSGRACGVRRGRGHRSQHFYAKRCAFRELCRGGFVRRECDAGGRIDFGLRKNGGGAERKGRLVRYFDAEGAFPDRRKEDDGL